MNVHTHGDNTMQKCYIEFYGQTNANVNMNIASQKFNVYIQLHKL